MHHRRSLSVVASAGVVALLAFGGCASDEGDDDAAPSTALPGDTAPATGPQVGTTETMTLAANICGEWLPPMPAFTTTIDGAPAGLRSLGDGKVELVPASEAEAGTNATLALLLSQQGWEVSRQVMRIWDGATHLDGGECPDGRTARLRWWDDGVEQGSDPSLHVLEGGEEVVLANVADGEDPGRPPTT